MIDKTTDWLARRLPLMFKLGASGLAIFVLGEIVGQRWVKSLGGWMLMPLTLVAGTVCALVVLIAPVWPLAGLADKVPTWARWPFMAVALMATLAWWGLWAAIVLGGQSDF